jgi:transcriptional regulator with XRE-family HTH domain
MESVDPVGAIVAANLKAIRLRRGLKLKELAKRLAVVLDQEKPLSESTISRWETPAQPRRFSMTELFAICSVLEIPLARLFLPDRDKDIPTIHGLPFHAVWNACFSKTEKYLPDWQIVERTERHPPGSSLELGLSEEAAAAYDVFRRASASPTDSADGSGEESP